MPVASPIDHTWKELDAAMRGMWITTTAASNWMTTELYAHDVRRNGQEKMPPMAPVYLYPKAREQFPLLPAQSVASLEHSVQRRYRAARYETIWTRARSLPTYRYPTPFPAPNQAWHPTLEDGKPIVSVRIKDERYRLRLKSGPQFRRQYKQFQMMARGEVVRGDLALYKKGDALMVKMVGWLPRTEQREKLDGVLSVRTTLGALLVAVNGKDEKLWSFNGDHLRRWQAEYAQQLQRWAEDSKFENRPVPSFAERRTAAVQKHSNRMNSAVHEIAAQLAGYAARRRFAVVKYDDRERGFCEQFPWVRLKELIAEKLDEYGITIEIASDEVKPEGPELLAA